VPIWSQRLPLENVQFTSNFHRPFLSHQAQKKTLGVQGQVQVNGDYPKGHCIMGFHSSTLGMNEDGIPSTMMPHHIQGPDHDLW
jgi:hypothetical protein